MKRVSDTADISKSQIRKSLAFVINYDLSFELKPISGFCLLESENPGAVEMIRQVRAPMFFQWTKFNSYDPCSPRGLSSIPRTPVWHLTNCLWFQSQGLWWSLAAVDTHTHAGTWINDTILMWKLSVCAYTGGGENTGRRKRPVRGAFLHIAPRKYSWGQSLAGEVNKHKLSSQRRRHQQEPRYFTQPRTHSKGLRLSSSSLV